MASSSEATCYSRIEKEYYNFKWVISDYSFIDNKDIKIDSDLFEDCSNEYDVKRFRLKLIKRTVVVSGCNEDSRLLGLYVAKMSSELMVKCKLAVIRDEKIVDTFSHYKTLSTAKGLTIFNIPREEMKKFVSSTDTITFRVELTFSMVNVINSMNDEVVKMDQVSTPILKFDWALHDERYSDVVLRTACGKEIPAHRVLLAAASPVFNAMFSHDMLENKSKSVNMADVGYEAALELLRYIYKGSIGELEISSTIDLLVAADKYQVEGLKNKCEKILSVKLSSENAVDILQVADKCSMKSLKKNAVDFIRQHINISSDSEDVGNMILSMTQLLSK